MLPIFSSDNSICDGVLTLSKDIFKSVTEEKDGEKITRETDEVEILSDAPVSIFAIAKLHSLDKICLVDSSMTGYWEAYKVSKGLKLDLVFGLKIIVCEDLNKKDPASLQTESKVIIFCGNSKAYYDLIKIVSKANIEGFYHHPRIDWPSLNALWTPNLLMAVPFYSSFLTKNLLNFGHSAMPDFSKINEPIFLREKHDLPFDALLAEGLEGYCKANSYEIMDSHSVYYYKDADAVSYQTLKCIQGRARNPKISLAKPELNHFGSNKFSFENYYRQLGKTL